MSEVYEDEYTPRKKEERGSICTKSVILLCLGGMAIVMLYVIYEFLIRVLGGPYYGVPFDFLTLLIFLIGAIFGFIIRDVTIKRAKD